MDANRQTLELIAQIAGVGVDSVEPDARDPKTARQEGAQARGLPPPADVETARSGPDHQPIFTIEARLESGETAEASAGSKRQAEQSAAKALLDALEGGA